MHTSKFTETGRCCVVYDGLVDKKSERSAYVNVFAEECYVKNEKKKVKRNWNTANVVRTNDSIVFLMITSIGKRRLFGMMVLFVLAQIATQTLIHAFEMLMQPIIICIANL